MKKILSMFLACLLLAASFAAAEDMKPVTLKENPLKLEGKLNDAGTDYIIVGEGQPGMKITFMLTNYAGEEPAGAVKGPYYFNIDTGSEGIWEFKIPVKDKKGTDTLDGLGDTASVHLWAKYVMPDAKYAYVGELIRMEIAEPEATQVPAVSMSSEITAGVEWSSEPTKEKVLTCQLRYTDSKEPYANKRVSLRLQGSDLVVYSTTDDNGHVAFFPVPEMTVDGAILIIFDEDSRQVGSFEISNEPAPAVPQQPMIPVQDAAPVNRADQAKFDALGGETLENKADGLLLRGIPDAVVYILCALFLVGYAACWFGLKFPEKFGGKRKGV